MQTVPCFKTLSVTHTDDEPDWGPHHYILLLGFYQPHLIAGLDAIGVHVSNVIKLCWERPQHIQGQQERGSCEGNEQRPGDSPVLDAGKECSVNRRFTVCCDFTTPSSFPLCARSCAGQEAGSVLDRSEARFGQWTTGLQTP